MNKGEDVRISDKAVIVRPALVEIGSHVAIDMGVYISTRALIGNYVHIAVYASIIGGAEATIIIEDFVSISAGARIIVISDDYSKGMMNPTVPAKYKHHIGERIVLGRFCAVGTNSIVLPDVEMAEGSVVGLGSVLAVNTVPWGMYLGNPARMIGFRDKKLCLKAAKKLGL